METTYTSFLTNVTGTHPRIGPAAAAFRDWMTCIYSMGSDLKNLRGDAFNLSEFNDVLYNINSEINWNASQRTFIDFLRNNPTEYDQLKMALRELKAQRNLFKTRIKLTLSATDTSRAEIEDYLAKFLQCAKSFTSCINPERTGRRKDSVILRKVLGCIDMFTNCLTGLNKVLKKAKSDTREKLENFLVFAAQSAVLFCVDNIGISIIDAFFNDVAATSMANRLIAAGDLERKARLYVGGVLDNDASIGFKTATDLRRRAEKNVESQLYVYGDKASALANTLSGGTIQKGLDTLGRNRYTINTGADVSRQKVIGAAQRVIDKFEDGFDWTTDTLMLSWQTMYPFIAKLIDGLWQGVYSIGALVASVPLSVMNTLPDLGFTTVLSAVMTYVGNLSGVTTQVLGTTLFTLRNLGLSNLIQVCYSAYVLFATSSSDMQLNNFLQQSVIGAGMFLLGRSINALASYTITFAVNRSITDTVDFDNNIKDIVRDALIDLNKTKPDKVAKAIHEVVSQASSASVSRDELMNVDMYELNPRKLKNGLEAAKRSRKSNDKRVYLDPSRYATELTKIYDPNARKGVGGFRTLSAIQSELENGCRVYKGVYPKDRTREVFILECP